MESFAKKYAIAPPILFNLVPSSHKTCLHFYPVAVKESNIIRFLTLFSTVQRQKKRVYGCAQNVFSPGSVRVLAFGGTPGLCGGGLLSVKDEQL